MTSMTIEISEALSRNLEEMARKQGKPVDEFVRDFLERLSAVEELRLLQDETVPYAEAAGFFTDEDVFKVIS
jgi:predicted transcriptional regulator